MVFSSLIFLFLFLPITLAVYYLVGNRFRNSLLLFASLVFYAWGEGLYVFLMLASIGINFVFGLLLDKQSAAQSRKYTVFLAIAANLSLLIFFKYSDFLLENLNLILGIIHFHPIKFEPTHLPVGISFFTFHSLSYIIDVFRRRNKAHRNPLQLGLYIALFPQLVAGPIIRYHDVAEQIISRRHTLEDFACGIERFIFGLGKKVLIANVMADMADAIFDTPINQLSISEAWLGIVCYTLQIYFDFSGYSDMAIGLGRMFGFRFLENFNYPYISQSMQEFWRRWHISLSNWFRDYLYIPLGGSRVGRCRTYGNLLIVFILCGLWHGASWTFFAWGLLHGFFLALERWKLADILQSWPRLFRHFYVLFVIIVGWVFFRVKTLEDGLHLGAMFGWGTTPLINPWGLNKTDNLIFFVLVAGIFFSMPVYPHMRTFVLKVVEPHRETGSVMAFGLYGCKLIVLGTTLMLSILSLASGTYNPFIYFRF